MYTQPKIVLSEQIQDRAYITFYYNGKRLREYNGKRLNLSINPNQCSNLKDKKRLIAQLQYEYTKALNEGWNPFAKELVLPSLKEALDEVLEEKVNSNLCDLYKRNLKGVHRMFTEFTPLSVLKGTCDELPLNVVETFLNQFQTSERNYINRRRCLGTLVNEIVRKGYAKNNIVKSTKPARAKASLHRPYSQEQLRSILDYLKINHPNLHLCCALTYGCMLRPHHEVRLLKVRHIVKDFTQIQLSGSENKSKRVRTVHIPDYIKALLQERIKDVTDKEINIFTLTHEPFSVGYFNLMWGKAKTKMLHAKLLEPNQTIYSFRHTAAINVYKKTKDIHILQQLLQHSNMIVTLTYLRGLGELNNDELKNVLPEL